MRRMTWASNERVAALGIGRAIAADARYRRTPEYGEDEIVRIAVIQRSKAAGMTLEQIAVLLDNESAGRHQVLQHHLDDLDRRIRRCAALEK